jgi:predicted regulator of Ras-like GTPase activity (Roadblock/LC7/MglB family)
MEERRTRRSERIDEALSYQLEACVARAGLKALVVADGDGLVVASSPWHEARSEAVAAALPLVAQGSDFAGTLLDEGAGAEHVLVSSFVAAESELYICAVGDFGGDAHREIARAKVGVRRILN